MMNEVQVGRYKALLEQLLAMKGDIATQQLAPELLPVLNLGNDRPEWSALQGERLCCGAVSDVAVAGENCHCQLMNVATSNSIVILENIRCTGWAGATNVYVGQYNSLASGGGAAAGAYGFRDGRFTQGTQQTAGQVYSLTAAGVQITSILARYVNQATGLNVDMAWVLPPGRGVMIALSTVNLALTVTFRWRERKIEPSELIAA